MVIRQGLVVPRNNLGIFGSTDNAFTHLPSQQTT